MSFQFDGPNKRIYVQSPTLTFLATDLYSEWKRWIILSDNSKYIQAMRSIGGDALSTTKFIAPYIELMNDWKIKPYDGDYQLSVEGNLFATEGVTPFIGADAGTVLISMETTGNALALSTNSETVTDTIAPVWTNAIGIIDAYQSGDLINIRWGVATDASNEVRYNVYISDVESSKYNFKLGSFSGQMVNISTEYDGVTDLSTGNYYIAVRAVDKFGNETTNTNYAIVNYVDTVSNTDVNVISVNGVGVTSINDFKGSLTAQEIWEYATRTLTSTSQGGGATAQEVWEYATRSLTEGSGLDEAQLHSALDTYTNKDNWKADLSSIPQSVWSYVTRELTVSVGLTTEQELKLDEIVSNTNLLPSIIIPDLIQVNKTTNITIKINNNPTMENYVFDIYYRKPGMTNFIKRSEQLTEIELNLYNAELIFDDINSYILKFVEINNKVKELFANITVIEPNSDEALKEQWEISL